MPNELVERTEAGVPAWMRKASTGVSIGNVDASDLKPPRLKLLAGQSPEIMDGAPGAAVGKFWMTIHNVNLGEAVTGSLVLLKKSYQLWAPKMPGNEQKGPLATASDAIHWDVPSQVFEVKFPQAMGGGTEVWVTKRTVLENGMSKFGSSRPGDPKSKPAATLTYDMLWVVDMPDGSKQLCVFTAARTGATPTQNFISTVKAKGVDQFYQRYQIVSQKKAGPTGDPYFTFEYHFLDTNMSEADGAAMRGLYDQYAKSGFVTDLKDEVDEAHRNSRPNGPAPTGDTDDIPF